MLKNYNDLSTIYNSARTIGRIGGNKSYQILKQILLETNIGKYNRSTDKKKATILGLGLCNDNRAIPFLKAEFYMTQNEMITRIHAAGALGLFGNDDGLIIAMESIKSNNSNVKLHSIEALGNIGSLSSLEILKKLIQPDEKTVYRMAAKTSITQIEANQLAGDEQIQYIQQKLIENPRNTTMILWGTSKLKQINNKSSISALKNLSQSSGANKQFLRQIASMKIRTIR
jgi:hypothetical protein